MSSSSGIGGSNPSPITPQTGATGGPEPSSGSVEAAMRTPVANLEQLKQVLVQNLGEEKGTKLYNSFLSSFTMLMIQQMQSSARQAEKASEGMRMKL